MILQVLVLDSCCVRPFSCQETQKDSAGHDIPTSVEGKIPREIYVRYPPTHPHARTKALWSGMMKPTGVLNKPVLRPIVSLWGMALVPLDSHSMIAVDMVRLITRKTWFCLNNSHDPWDERYIHLHEWLIFVGKYTSPMDPMGNSNVFETTSSNEMWSSFLFNWKCGNKRQSSSIIEPNAGMLFYLRRPTLLC